ncbi:MAG: hypothetical protein KDB80_15090 [Planctomycetes bacterium]|nr:hypothetical protein [Planctomycetota bacterium]
MILAWIVWFFLVPQLFWLDRVLAGTLVRPLDLGLAVCFVLALFARTRALPALLLAAAVGRSLIDDGSVALHFLALGVPVAVLLPARGVFRGIVWQASAAAFLALAVPRVGGFFARITHTGLDAVEPSTVASVVWAAILVPPVGWLMRQLPPLAAFVEVEP